MRFILLLGGGGVDVVLVMVFVLHVVQEGDGRPVIDDGRAELEDFLAKIFRMDGGFFFLTNWSRPKENEIDD